MFGTVVNPATIVAGDTIATDISKGGRILSSRKVKSAGPCPSNGSLYHIDGECYDPRFISVTRV